MKKSGGEDFVHDIANIIALCCKISSNESNGVLSNESLHMEIHNIYDILLAGLTDLPANVCAALTKDQSTKKKLNSQCTSVVSKAGHEDFKTLLKSVCNENYALTSTVLS